MSFRFKCNHEIAYRYSTQVTQKQLLVAVHLASQRVQKINCNSLDKALLGITDSMQKDSHKALIFKKLKIKFLLQFMLLNMIEPTHHIGRYRKLAQSETSVAHHRVVRQMRRHSIQQSTYNVIL